MMPLVHVVSKSNMQALPDVIKFMKQKKYRFGTVDEFVTLPGDEKEVTSTRLDENSIGAEQNK